MIRFRFIFWLSILGFIFLITRFYAIQILYKGSGQESRSFVKFNKETSKRGEIYDSNHQPLAINRQTFDVYLNTELAKKKEVLKRELKKELNVKNASLSAILKQDNWQKIKDNISLAKKKKLDKYYPEYLNFEEDSLRYYPEGSSSAYTLGFLGKSEIGAPQGYVGLEGYYNQELQGLPVINENEADLRGINFIGGILSDRKNITGLDLILTIDKNVQQIVETALKQGLKAYEAKKACAILMDPYNGQVLAQSCLPGFDPAKYYEHEESDFVNPNISQVYEPGSTFKPLIVAIGLENNRFRKNTVVNESGPYVQGEYSIATWDNKYRGKISVGETLSKSSNVGMVELIKKIPKKEVNTYFDLLGLRNLTGIELQAEASGLIKDVSNWYEIDYLTYSFGQGLAITPIELIAAFSTLANDGYFVKPSIVKSFYDPNADEYIKPSLSSKRKVFSKKTVKTMKQLLLDSVNSSEAYWPNKPKGYKICGKTGTAQIPIKGVYDPTHTIASFIGFVPCDSPKYIALILYREPKSSPWGSETAAPTFFEIVSKLNLYYNIAP